MHDICFITTCMGRLAHLQQTLGAAVAQPGCSCVVVDYSCPEQCGVWVEQHYPQVKVVRVANQSFFSLTRARNAGAAAADAPWLCFFDADVILSPDFARQVAPTLRAGHYYLAQPRKRGLSGTVICTRDDFRQLGGYDDVIQGWGEDDMDFYSRLLRRGLRPLDFPSQLLTLIEHDNQMRVQHFPIKSVPVSQTINRLYCLAKLDLMNLLGRNLSDEERRNLHAEATQTVQLSLQNKQETRWRILFRQSPSFHGEEIHSTLVYTLKPPVIE
jgi:glycosyltransferase involved in cell wall biosynthesis